MESKGGWGVAWATIYGVRFGFEFVPKDDLEDEPDDPKWMMVLDLFIIRIMYAKY